MFEQFAFKSLLYLAVIFVVIFGVIILTLIVIYIIDITQSQHTIRRNYPVIGRFRYWFEHLGEFFRQYFSSLRAPC